MGSKRKTNSKKKPGSLGTYLLALTCFLVAGAGLYLTYFALKTGTLPKLGKTYPRGAPLPYVGVYTRQENPARFWTGEIFFLLIAIAFAALGLRILWEEHKRRRHETRGKP
jgi:hypothetical protein